MRLSDELREFYKKIFRNDLKGNIIRFKSSGEMYG